MIDHDNLEEFTDAINYDRTDTSDTGVAFYSAFAKETGGPILELACGTGRVSIPIARQGFAVTGLDIVPAMLEQARRKSAGLPIQWLEGDARDFQLADRFRLAFLTGNAFQAFLTNDDQKALLQRVHEHLHDEGLFAFESRNPRLISSSTQDGLFVSLETNLQEEPSPPYTDIHGREIRVSRTQIYDPIAQILHLKTFHRRQEKGTEQTKITRIALRFTFPQELAALLSYNGFHFLRQYGDWNLEPLTESSNSIIVVCGKRV